MYRSGEPEPIRTSRLGATPSMPAFLPFEETLSKYDHLSPAGPKIFTRSIKAHRGLTDRPWLEVLPRSYREAGAQHVDLGCAKKESSLTKEHDGTGVFTVA